MKDDRETLPALCNLRDEHEAPERKQSRLSKDANRLTAKRIERLKEPGRYHDGRGLYLQITPSGSKSWLLRYERDGRERMLGLGPLHTISLKDAREKARKARAQLLDGIDPLAERRGRRTRLQLEASAAVTFREAAMRFLKTHEGAWTNAVHREGWVQTLSDYAFPIIGSLPVAAIDTNLVLKVLEPIWATKNVTAQRLRGRIERVLDWAKAAKLRTGDNPARWKEGELKELLAKPTPSHKHHAALPYKEVPAFIAELREREGSPARALEITILSACRTREVVEAKWDEINLTEREWIIPAERMKIKNGKEHRVPLSDRMIEIIEALPPEEGNEFIFVGDRPMHCLHPRSLFGLLRDLRRDITVHGFRSSFSDWAHEETGTEHYAIEASLAHVAGKVERAYHRGDLFKKRRTLMEAWSAFCNGETEAANVVQFNKAG